MDHLRSAHGNTDNLGGVTCVSAFDVTENMTKEVLVGRDDGTVQVYRLDSFDDYPELIFQTTPVAGLRFLPLPPRPLRQDTQKNSCEIRKGR